MKTDWQTKKLDDACEVEYGTRVVNKKHGGSKYPVYGGGGATFFMDRSNRKDRMVIARFAMSEQCTRFVPGEFFLNDSGLTISPKNNQEVSQDFLDWETLFLNDRIYSLARGSAQKNLDVPAFRKMDIVYPGSLAEQKRIVKKLDEVFEKVTNAKEAAEKNLQNSKELFESYLNNVFANPGKDWEEKSISEISSKLGDGLHGTPKYSEDGEYYFINGNNLNDGKIELKDRTKRVSAGEYHKHKKDLNERTILVSINGTLGNVAFYNGEKVILGKSACYLNLKDGVDKFYIKFVLSSPYFLKYAHREATGATIKNVSLKSMREFKVPLPSFVEQKLIVKKLDALSVETKKLEKIYEQKLADLEELKKSVLSKAFHAEL